MSQHRLNPTECAVVAALGQVVEIGPSTAPAQSVLAFLTRLVTSLLEDALNSDVGLSDGASRVNRSRPRENLTRYRVPLLGVQYPRGNQIVLRANRDLRGVPGQVLPQVDI